MEEACTNAAIAHAISARTTATAAAVRGGWLEPFAFTASVLLYVWWLVPRVSVGAGVACVLPIVAMPIVSNLWHRDGAASLGLRFDNFARSGREVGLWTLGAAALVVLLAWTSGHGVAHSGLPVALAIYPVWGFAQQYALQGFVHRRVRERWRDPHAAACVAAGLFALVHLPNPVLTPATAVAGYVWCRLHARAPNLITLALSHALLAALLFAGLPDAWHHHMRIGPGFWLFH